MQIRDDILLTLPLVIPLVAASICLLGRHRLRLQRIVSTCASGASLAVAVLLLVKVWREGVLASSIGGWPAPFGIVLVADQLSSIMLVLATLKAFAVGIYAIGSIDAERERHGYHPLFQILMMGICGAFLTGDLFNLYVWFEVMLMASFVLLALGGERAQLEGAVKYVALNLLSSVLFLAAVGILYGTAGTLNMADLAVWLAANDHQKFETVTALLFLGAFGVKAAVFPLFFWLPAAYHTPPVAVSAIFAGLLTKVGVYALIRVFTLLFVHDVVFTHNLILVIAALTMITGVLGAAVQGEMRRILSFHIVSQIGYMVMGLGLYSRLALAGAIFYIIHHIVVKTNLFLVSGLVQRLRGTFELKKLGGMSRDFPWLAILFLIPAFSLAGIPPLSGFWAKYVLVRSALELEHYVVAAVALLVGVLTLFSMTKIWAEVFWKAEPAELAPVSPAGRPASLAWMVVPVAGLALITVAIGLGAEGVFAIADRAAQQLLDPSAYIDAVLGERR